MLDLVDDHPIREIGYEPRRVVHRGQPGDIVIETDVVVARSSTDLKCQRTLPALPRTVNQYRRRVLQRFLEEGSNVAFV